MATAIVPLTVALAGHFIQNLITPITNVNKLDPLSLRAISEFGSPLPLCYGTVRIDGLPMFWALPLVQTKSGKGLGPRENVYRYYMFAAFMIGGTITGIKRIWANNVQIFDYDSKTGGAANGQNFFQRLVQYERGQLSYIDAYQINNNSRQYTDHQSEYTAQHMEMFFGDPTQVNISSTISSLDGTNIPSFRGRSYIVFNRYDISKFNGNGFPKLDVVVYGKLGPLPLVNDIITDICANAGIPSTRLDLSDLDPYANIQGVTFQRAGETWQDYLQELQRLFFVVVREEGDKLVFLNKNRPSINLNLTKANLGAKLNSGKSGDLFKETILPMREIPSEVQIVFRDLGDSMNQRTVYARNPLSTVANPLSIQTRQYSNSTIMNGVAHRTLSEVIGQRATYSGITLLPCWYNKLKLGDVISLDIGNRTINIQLTKLLLTKDYLCQIEGNQYASSEFSKPVAYYVIVQCQTVRDYAILDNGNNIIGTLPSGTTLYLRTQFAHLGNSDNPKLVVAIPTFPNNSQAMQWGIQFGDGVFIALDSPGSGAGLGKQINQPYYRLTQTQGYNGDHNLDNYQDGGFWFSNPYKFNNGISIAPDDITNASIYGIVQIDNLTAAGYGQNGANVYTYNWYPQVNGQARNWNIYNDSQFFAIDQARSNSLPQQSTNYYGTSQPPQATLYPLDIPLLHDSDTPLGLYFAIQSVYRFSTGAIYMSTDGGNTFNNVLSANGASTMGTLVGSIPLGVANIIDTTSTITVSTNQVINPVTMDQFLAGQNLILIGSEIVAFRDVTLLGNNQYKLSYLIRGARGTEAAINSHSQGERAILLDSTIVRLALTQNRINQSIQFKIVPTSVSEPDISTVATITYTGQDGTPYSVTDLTRTTDNAGNINLSWNRRTYRNGGLVDYTDIPYSAGEQAQWLVQVTAGSGVLNAYTVTTESFTYTPTMQTADGYTSGNFTIKQLSSYVGYGIPASI